MRRALAALGMTAAFLPVAPASAANGFLQPGDYMVAGNAGCTTNFVYDGTGAQAGKVYLGTAAHCVASVGQDVRDSSGTVWGDVALIGNPNAAAPDYAFIEVRPGHVSRVSAAVKGHATYPKGVATFSETSIGDLVQISGYGLGYSTTTATQERRQAVVSSDSGTTHSVAGPIHFGDSGGPLVHVRTGKAYGIVSRACIGACTETGPTVEGLIAAAAARGFTVALRTV